MRPGLRWALGASLVATLLALALPPPDEHEGGEPRQVEVSAAAGAGAQRSAELPSALGGSWRRLAASPGAPLAPARADPFGLPTAAAPVAVALPVQTPQVPVPVQVVEVPAARYRVAGWLDVGGTRRWLLSDGEHEVLAAAGLALRDGYTVREMKPEGIQLQHPPTGTELVLPIPTTSFNVQPGNR